MGCERHWPLHEFRDVVTAHELTVIVRIGSGQFERLGSLTVCVNMCDEGSCEGAVVSAAADDDPSAVARPGVIALGIGRVDFVHRSYLTGLQVERPDIGIGKGWACVGIGAAVIGAVIVLGVRHKKKENREESGK